MKRCNKCNYQTNKNVKNCPFCNTPFTLTENEQNDASKEEQSESYVPQKPLEPVYSPYRGMIVNYVPPQYEGKGEKTSVPAIVPLILGIAALILGILTYFFSIPFTDLGAIAAGLLAIIFGSLTKSEGKRALIGAILGIVGFCMGAVSAAASCAF